MQYEFWPAVGAPDAFTARWKTFLDAWAKQGGAPDPNSLDALAAGGWLAGLSLQQQGVAAHTRSAAIKTKSSIKAAKKTPAAKAAAAATPST